MMRNKIGSFVGAALLILVGVLLLLQNLNVIESGWELVWALGFAAGGIAFLAVFAGGPRANWWAVIPGLVLLSLGILIAFGDALGAWEGAMFLGAIGLAFWIVYFTNQEYWWAVIPGGVLLTLTAVIGLSESRATEGMAIGSIFFLGLGLTFGLVFLLPTPEGRMKWAIWPAGVMLVMGIILALASYNVVNWLWAAALIAAGVYLVVRALLGPKSAPPAPPTEAVPPPIEVAPPPEPPTTPESEG